MLFNVPEDVASQTKANFEQALRFTEKATEASEKLFELNVRTAKAAGADVVSQIKALTSVKDVQELAGLQTTFAQSNAEKVAGYARAVYGWATETQGEVSRLFETQVAEINKNIVETIDRAAKSAPTGSEFAFAALKSALTAANQAYDVISKAGKQVAAYTETTLSTPVVTSATAADVAAAASRKRAA
jgi:phasin family protein